MPGYLEKFADPERGEPLPLGGFQIVSSPMDIDDLKEELGGEAWSETLEVPSDPDSGEGTMDNSSSDGPYRAKSHKERRDFDDGANALWSLYGEGAKTNDEDRFSTVAAGMDVLLLFAGLFSAVLTSFLVESARKLQENPAQESAFYQRQSVFPTPSTPPPPYPKFYPSSSSVRVNIFWLISLICSLSAALIATHVRQWVRSYMQVFKRYDHPLKRARSRQFFFEGANRVLKLADAVPRLIHISLLLFFLGLGDSMLNTNTTVGTTIIVLICICGSFYLYNVSAPLRNLQLPYQTLISRSIFFLMQKFLPPYFGARFLRKQRMPISIEAYQEELVMEETDERKGRDVRAIRWLVDSTAVNAEMEPLVLAIPGSFNTEWGREVWREASFQVHDMSDPLTGSSLAGGQVSTVPHPSHPLEGAAIDTIS
ncbi:hypothetical protein BJY52DRAFT_1381239 [Lactarius psammicola]|nr:hypothetical protein BJY52DRAFT_1381239 [Lactarius psammicola]